jgi:DNA-binding MarR family transcriptional regulator
MTHDSRQVPMTDFSADDVVRLRSAMARIAKFTDRQVAADGLTRTQLSLLGTISRLRSASPSELAEIEGLNPTMLSRLLGKLEADSWLVRTADPQDGRAIRVELTKTGARRQQRIRAQRAALLRERLDKLAEPARADLLQALPALEELAEQLATPDRTLPLSRPER